MRVHVRPASVAILFLASIVSRGTSQVAPREPHQGDRVRVWGADGPRIGVFDALQADSIFLRGRLPLSLGPNQRLDISVGRKGHALEGLGLGFLAGGIAGVLAGSAANGSGDPMDIGAALGAAAIGLGVWAGLTITGGVVGQAIKSDRWQRAAPRPSPSGHSLATPGAGVGPFTATVRIPIRFSF